MYYKRLYCAVMALKLYSILLSVALDCVTDSRTFLAVVCVVVQSVSTVTAAAVTTDRVLTLVLTPAIVHSTLVTI